MINTRRQFLRLTALALGGIAAGCGDSDSGGMTLGDGSLNPDQMGMDTGTGPVDRGYFPDVRDAEPLEPEDITDILDGLPDTTVALDEMVALFFGEDLEAVQMIGQTFVVDLGDLSAQETADILSESLMEIAEMEDVEMAVEQLHSQVEADFTDVHLENVRGWWLSKTEVHLCTLAFLLRVPEAPTVNDLNTDVE